MKHLITIIFVCFCAQIMKAQINPTTQLRPGTAHRQVLLTDSTTTPIPNRFLYLDFASEVREAQIIVNVSGIRDTLNLLLDSVAVDQTIVASFDGEIATFSISEGNTDTINLSSLKGSEIWSLNGTNAYYNGGNVGIGTSTPNEALEVAGRAILDNIFIYSPNSTSIAMGRDIGGLIIGGGVRNTTFGAGAGGLLTNGDDNAVLGYNAGANLSTAKFATLMGSRAGEFITTNGATFFGSNAGRNSVGVNNSGVGREVFEDGIGSDNFYLGSFAGAESDGNRNIGFGDDAGRNNIGSDNAFLARFSGKENIGSRNFIGGSRAGWYSVGDDNIFFGEDVGIYNSGRRNIFLGGNKDVNFQSVHSLTDANTDVTNNRITGVPHGQPNGANFLVRFSGSEPLGIANNANVAVTAINSTTIELLNETITGTNGDYDVSIFRRVSNSFQMGYDVNNTRDNQGLLGGVDEIILQAPTGIGFGEDPETPKAALHVKGNTKIEDVPNDNTATQFLVWSETDSTIQHRVLDFNTLAYDDTELRDSLAVHRLDIEENLAAIIDTASQIRQDFPADTLHFANADLEANMDRTHNWNNHDLRIDNVGLYSVFAKNAFQTQINTTPSNYARLYLHPALSALEHYDPDNTGIARLFFGEGSIELQARSAGDLGSATINLKADPNRPSGSVGFQFLTHDLIFQPLADISGKVWKGYGQGFGEWGYIDYSEIQNTPPILDNQQLSFNTSSSILSLTNSIDIDLSSLDNSDSDTNISTDDLEFESDRSTDLGGNNWKISDIGSDIFKIGGGELLFNMPIGYNLKYSKVGLSPSLNQVLGVTSITGNVATLELINTPTSSDNQTLSFTSPNISITGGNNVSLASLYQGGTGINIVGTTITNTDPDQIVTMTEGSNVSITGTYPNFTVAVPSVADADSDPTNEKVVSFSASNGNIVLNEAGINHTILGDGVDNQQISFANDILSLENGGTVDLSQYATINQNIANSNLLFNDSYVATLGAGNTWGIESTNGSTSAFFSEDVSYFRAASGSNSSLLDVRQNGTSAFQKTIGADQMQIFMSQTGLMRFENYTPTESTILDITRNQFKIDVSDNSRIRIDDGDGTHSINDVLTVVSKAGTIYDLELRPPPSSGGSNNQTLSLSGTELSISGGNTVDLAGIGGGSGTNTNLANEHLTLDDDRFHFTNNFDLNISNGEGRLIEVGDDIARLGMTFFSRSGYYNAYQDHMQITYDSPTADVIHRLDEAVGHDIYHTIQPSGLNNRLRVNSSGIKFDMESGTFRFKQAGVTPIANQVLGVVSVNASDVATIGLINQSGGGGGGGDPTDELQTVNVTESGTNRTISLSGNGSSDTFSVADNDNSSSNELQSITGTTVSGNPAIQLSSSGGNVQFNATGDATVSRSGNIITFGATGGGGGTIQNLTFNNPNLSISGGNTVDLSALSGGSDTNIGNTNLTATANRILDLGNFSFTIERNNENLLSMDGFGTIIGGTNNSINLGAGDILFNTGGFYSGKIARDEFDFELSQGGFFRFRELGIEKLYIDADNARLTGGNSEVRINDSGVKLITGTGDLKFEKTGLNPQVGQLLSVSSTNGDVAFLDLIDATTTGDDDWTINGNDIYNANTGNVGIGTNSPQYGFDFRSDIGSLGVFGRISSTSGSSNNNLYFLNVGGNNFELATSTIGVNGGSGISFGNSATYGDFAAIGAKGRALFITEHGTVQMPSLPIAPPLIGVEGGLYYGSSLNKLFYHDGANYLEIANNGTSSDARLKKNVTTYQGGLEKLKKLPIFGYEYNGKNGTIEGEKRIGLMAQDLEKVEPKLVSEDESGYLQIEDRQLVYLLMNAVQELSEKVEIQSKIIEELKEK